MTMNLFARQLDVRSVLERAQELFDNGAATPAIVATIETLAGVLDEIEREMPRAAAAALELGVPIELPATQTSTVGERLFLRALPAFDRLAQANKEVVGADFTASFARVINLFEALQPLVSDLAEPACAEESAN